MIVLLIIGSTGWCQSDSSKAGWYFINGVQWSGTEVADSHFGYYMGSGRWFSFARNCYFITPISVQVGLASGDNEGMLSFTPQMVLKLGRVMVSASPGFSNYYADNNVVSYGKIESSITWLFSELWEVVLNDDGSYERVRRAHTGGLTLAFQFMPGNKHKALMLGFTIIN
jgi:hypothetical protein